MKSKTVLTIDSGGSKTKLTLYGDRSDIKRQSVYRGFGAAADKNGVISELLSVLREFCGDIEPYAVVCNLGGKNKDDFAVTLKEAFPKARLSVFRESEGDIGRTLCEMYGAQVTLMAGTGSIAIAPVGEKTVVCGGWGANIGDKGSGYQLGLDAIKTALEEADGTAEFSLLAKTVLGEDRPQEISSAREQCAYRDKIRQKLAPLDRYHIASYAKTVFKCAESGDEVSLSLYRKTGEDLADVVISAAVKAGVALEKVVVTGGMVNAKEFWKDSFERRLRKFYGFKGIVYLADGVDTAMLEIAKTLK